jgi:hypothetical protein
MNSFSNTLVFGIPVGGDLDLELWGLLHTVDDRAVLVGGLQIISQLSFIMEYAEGSLHLRQAQCLFNNVSLSCPAESSMQTRPTEFEAQLIEFLRGVPAVAHKKY